MRNCRHVSSFSINNFNSRLGEEFDEETTDGRKCKTTVTMEGNKLITNQKATGGGKDALAVNTIVYLEIPDNSNNLGERVLR